MKLRKITATLFTAFIAISTISISNINAEENNLDTSILLGDVNFDGVISLLDAQAIENYLNGDLAATQLQFTAMDYNQDEVIDAYDAVKIKHDNIYGYSYNDYDSLYTLPDNIGRTYYKHICNTGTSSSFSTYFISAASNVLSSVSANENAPYIDNSDAIDIPDNENTNCVKLVMTDYNNNSYLGSGFIISNKIIATAAHCLYDNGFMKSVQVYIYNEDCSALLAHSTAKNIHIPANYVTTNSTYRPNYDYGLIYLNNIIYDDDDYDISDDIVDVGVMTNEFMYTDSYITTSGFTGDVTHSCRRYYSLGQIANMDSIPIEKPYRFKCSAYCNGGQSGGMAYFKPYSTFKSTVGIVTHTATGYETYGMRFTPTLLRFYLQNNNFS